MFCEQCGAPVAENDRFCGECGSPVVPLAASAVTAPAAETTAAAATEAPGPGAELENPLEAAATGETPQPEVEPGNQPPDRGETPAAGGEPTVEGWYLDDERPGRWRWWDGSAWGITDEEYATMDDPAA